MMLDMHPWAGLSDDVRLGVLTEWVTADLVDEVLAECDVRDQRPGALPARFMVYYVLALALFQPDSYDDVAENLVGALEGMDEAIPNKSSFTRARQRLGAAVIEAVFRRLAGPVAPPGLAGAFWRGMRVAAVDGFLLDVPDTPVNRAVFGGPVAAGGQPSGFPQARVVTLTERTDPVAFPAGELAALYRERWESEGSYRQVKTFQRGPQEILRSADPELVRQEIWAHLAVHHCLTRIIMRLAAGERIDPDRISFVKVLKHARRSVIRQSAETSVQIRQFMATMAAKVRRKLDNGIRRLREADRSLKRPASKYSF